MVALLSILPILALATPVAASHEDECAGGVDASDSKTDPTTLQVLAGCVGAMYNSPGGSGKHADDFRDNYVLRVEGTGTAQMHWQLCNNAKEAPLIYDVYWDSDIMPTNRVAVGVLDVGECTSPDPAVVKGDYRPGEWKVWLWTYEEYLPENKSLDYFLYVQPLWR